MTFDPSFLPEPVPLLRGHVNPLRQLAPKDLVLCFQIPDLASEFFVRRRGDHVQDGLEDARHGVISLKCCTAKEMATFLHPRRGRSSPGKVAIKTPLRRRGGLLG